MEKYRKKPVVIEAAQWHGKTLADVIAFCDKHGLPHSKFSIGQRHGLVGMIIRTQEGDMVAQKGDYIVKGVKGEYYPVKPEIFLKTYEKL